MSSNWKLGPRLIPQLKPEFILHPQIHLLQRLLVAPALASKSPKKRQPTSAKAVPYQSKELSKSVQSLVRAEDSSSPLTDRQILAELRRQPKWHGVKTQDIARVRFAVGIPPSRERFN